MATINTIQVFDLDGVSKDFPVPFEYLARKFVQVTLLGTTRTPLTLVTEFVFTNATTIRTLTAWGPAQGYTQIEVRRVTSATDRIVDFNDATILRAQDLNVSELQSMHIAEEARNSIADVLGLDANGNLDARFRRIVNVANPIDGGDAINKAVYDADLGGVAQARAAAEAAKVAAEAAKVESAASAALSAQNAAKADQLRADLRASSGSAIVGFSPEGPGAQPSDLQTFARKFGAVSVFGFLTDQQRLDVINRTGLYDLTAPLQAFRNYLEANRRSGYMPGGLYRQDGQVTKEASFFAASVTGDGWGETIIKHNNPAGTAAWLFLGGSGSECGGVIHGIYFQGNGSNNSVEVADQCGFDIEQCRFADSRYGIVLNNRSGFTEYVIARRCLFDTTCRTPLVYRRTISTGGHDSFHGSGMDQCHINESATEVLPKIEIGGPSSESQNIVPYNSPLTFQIWKNTSTPVIDNYSWRSAVNFHGHITVENFTNNPYVFARAVNIAGSPAATSFFYVGTFNELTGLGSMGVMKLVSYVSFISNGTPLAIYKPYSHKIKDLVAGTTRLCTLAAEDGAAYQVVINIRDRANPYQRVLVLQVQVSAAIKVVVVATDVLNYFGGLQPNPTFAMDGQTLTMTSAWSGTQVFCKVTVNQNFHDMVIPNYVADNA